MSAIWALVGAIFVLLIAGYSLSDLLAITGGRPQLILESLAVAYAACALIGAALVLLLIGAERLQRRLGKASEPGRPFTARSWAGAALANAWVAFVTSPFLAPSVVAGDWAETVKLTLMVGGVIIGFLAAIILIAIVAEARRRS
jgi:hypothetical protein